MTLDVASRFWAKVDASAGILGCWPWQGRTTPQSPYGRLRINGVIVGVHRIALTLSLARELGSGMEALHSCDNPPCCNPLHLFEGTVADNMRDKAAKGRAYRRGKLTWRSAETIRAMHRDGVPVAALAALFGIAKRTVHHVLSGHTWPPEQARQHLIRVA